MHPDPGHGRHLETHEGLACCREELNAAPNPTVVSVLNGRELRRRIVCYPAGG
jgi:hypothetical protein